MSLSGKTLKNSYIDLLQMDNSNGGVGGSLRRIKDGSGDSTAMMMASDAVRIIPPSTDNTSVFQVRGQTGTDLFTVDSTNASVTALTNIVNTQYATFSVDNATASSFVDDTHHPIPFSNSNYGVHTPNFATGTEPAPTFTTADASSTRASDLVPVMWYVPDAMSIDSINSIEGADNATGDTTRMHLFSYTFTSGATLCLTAGTLLAHNSDVTNAGSEQPYLTTWTIDSAAVTAGKVILAFFKSDSINSDYSINITVKYHLT